VHRIVAVVLSLIVLATPCVYDLASSEPSPLWVVLSALGQFAWP
jgi:hypothetical protein